MLGFRFQAPATALALLFAAMPAFAKDDTPNLAKPPGKEWLTIGGDWHNSRYSTLKQINTGNVKNLKAAWVTHLSSGLGSRYGLEATPIVSNGVMYVSTGNDEVLALDARTGGMIWEYFSHIDQNTTTNCCGWDNRGVAIGDGKVFSGQLDGHMVALSQKTGEVLWNTEVGKTTDGYAIAAAPLYYNGVVYTGISGGDRQARGKLTALDAKTGKINWVFWTVPDPGQIGSNTWPSPTDPNPVLANAYKIGGANIWNTPAVDPELGLLYFSTGQPGPVAAGIGANRPGDNLFSASIVALHLDGTYAWHFQEVHHDLWDFDAPSPVLLFDSSYNGKPRKGIAQAGKTGYLYILDRTDGKPLIGIDEKPVEQEPRAFTSKTQPIPVGDPFIKQCPDPMPGWTVKCIFGAPWAEPALMAPGGNGGANWANMAYSPDTGYLYVSAAQRANGRLLNGTGHTAPPAIGAKYSGTYTAIDVHTNKIVWQKTTPFSIGQGSGTLATAGGLLFHGQPDGNFEAYDAKTGNTLWQFQTGAGADAPAITYELDGQQYVTIAAGGTPTQTTSANGDMVWTFTLKGSPSGQVIPPFAAPPLPPAAVAYAGEAQKTDKVRVVDFAYTPNRLTVVAGTTVTFTNAGELAHAASSKDLGGWDTGAIDPGKSATVKLDKIGTYNFVDTAHPFTVGQVIVTDK